MKRNVKYVAMVDRPYRQLLIDNERAKIKEMVRFEFHSEESNCTFKHELTGIARNFSFEKSNEKTIEVGYRNDIYVEKKFGHEHPMMGKVCKFTLFNVHQFDNYIFSNITCYCTFRDYLMLCRCEACKIECIYSKEKEAFVVTEVLDCICLEEQPISSNDCRFNHKPAEHCPGYEGKGIKSVKKCLKILKNDIDSKLEIPNNLRDTIKVMEYLDKRYEKLGEFCVNNRLPKNFIMNLLKEVVHGHVDRMSPANYRGLLLTPSSLYYLHKFMTIAYVSLIYNDYQKISFDYFMSVSESIYDGAILPQIKYEEYYGLDDIVLEEEERRKALSYYTNMHTNYMNGFSNNVPDTNLCLYIYDDIMKRYYPSDF